MRIGLSVGIVVVVVVIAVQWGDPSLVETVGECGVLERAAHGFRRRCRRGRVQSGLAVAVADEKVLFSAVEVAACRD
ncbi:hypothetical protein AB0B25_28585 [Nocardia sp. NPDC049190]|uniref:hypothetical protein n=1 Tax=Nocardia sp. NPDC049190 TaxID=3155650 RepID=UPI0033C963A9